MNYAIKSKLLQHQRKTHAATMLAFLHLVDVMNIQYQVSASHYIQIAAEFDMFVFGETT